MAIKYTPVTLAGKLIAKNALPKDDATVLAAEVMKQYVTEGQYDPYDVACETLSILTAEFGVGGEFNEDDLVEAVAAAIESITPESGRKFSDDLNEAFPKQKGTQSMPPNPTAPSSPRPGGPGPAASGPTPQSTPRPPNSAPAPRQSTPAPSNNSYSVGDEAQGVSWADVKIPTGNPDAPWLWVSLTMREPNPNLINDFILAWLEAMKEWPAWGVEPSSGRGGGGEGFQYGRKPSTYSGGGGRSGGGGNNQKPAEEFGIKGKTQVFVRQYAVTQYTPKDGGAPITQVALYLAKGKTDKPVVKVNTQYTKNDEFFNWVMSEFNAGRLEVGKVLPIGNNDEEFKIIVEDTDKGYVNFVAWVPVN